MTRGRRTRRQRVRPATDVHSTTVMRSRQREDTGADPAYAHAVLAIGGQQTATPTPGSQLVSGPTWNFILFTFQDPFTGQVTRPETPPPGTRYVAADVAIDNASDQSLNFWTLGAVRLRDSAGVEYEAGSTVGTEPRLSTQNLAGGERARGWVWFTVPADARLTTLVFIGPAPEFRFSLSSNPSG